MKVFISWSGELSKQLGEAFRQWLPGVLQAAKPYFTPNDIEKGAKWEGEIARELKESKIGVFCLTAESLNSPWLMFEAGAISNVIGKANVCPILFNLEPSDVTPPLSQFQLTGFEKKDMHDLLRTINNHAGEQKLDDKTCDTVFEMWWPELENKVSNILDKNSSRTKVKKRSDRDILKEVLSLTRYLVAFAHNNRKNKFSLLNSLTNMPVMPNSASPSILGQIFTESHENEKGDEQIGPLGKLLAQNMAIDANNRCVMKYVIPDENNKHP